MKSVALDLHYLPNLEFFAAIEDAEEILIFSQDLYQRQSYLNRAHIRLANKVETISVPVQGRRPRICLQEVLIDYTQKWQSVHLRGIQSAYGKAPFFEYFFPYFESVITQKPESLWDLNLQMLTVCLKLLKSSAKLVICDPDTDLARSLDLRKIINPKSSFRERSFYQPIPYNQLFGFEFELNLSIIDLLFCEGPAAKKIIAESVKKQ